MRQRTFKISHPDAEMSIDVPDDDRGTELTLWGMAAFADDAAANSAELRRIAAPLSRCRDKLGAVYRYLSKRVHFVLDPVGKELVRYPGNMAQEILNNGFTRGDCDDSSTLGAALLRCLGVRPCFFVVGTRGDGPFSHVIYGGEREPGRFIPIDSQHRFFGIFPGIARRISPFVWEAPCTRG